jgi:peptide deformylase
MLAVPEFASTTPVAAGSGLANAAEQVGNVEQARWYYRRYRVIRVYRYRRHCWHRRYRSGRRSGSGYEVLATARRCEAPAACVAVPRLTRWRSPRKSPRMALRDIIIIPDKRLRQVSEPVQTVDAEVRTLVDDMFETMYKAPGVGLAAIQVAVPKRIVTVDIAKKDEPKNPQVFINPEILWSSEEKGTYEEGCLSIPEYYEEVERPTQVKVRYMDLDGKTHEIDANGFLATVLQHEIDHINGVLFIDHISKLKRDRVIKKYTKAAKRADE